MKEPEKKTDFIKIEIEDLSIFLEKTYFEKYKEEKEITFKVPNRGKFKLHFKVTG